MEGHSKIKIEGKEFEIVLRRSLTNNKWLPYAYMQGQARPILFYDPLEFNFGFETQDEAIKFTETKLSNIEKLIR